MIATIIGMLRGSSTRDAKPTTVRLVVRAGLFELATIVRKSLNSVKDAVRSFTDERAIKRLKALREKDPTFESSIARFAEAESRLSEDDPVEGTPIDDESKPVAPAPPARTLVHDMLRG